MVEVASKLNRVLGARMTGGGFGGCTLNLVQTEELSEFNEQIVSRYQARMRLTPLVYVCSAAEGAGTLFPCSRSRQSIQKIAATACENNAQF